MNESTHSIWKKLTATAIAAILCTGIGISSTGFADAATVSQTTVGSSISRISTAPTLTDTQLNSLITRLEQLPEYVKQANPKDIPNYATKLDRFLAGGSFSDGPLITTMGTNWPQCIFEIGLLVVQYGIPVFKVIKWFKEAKAIWGGVSGIWWAIQHGVAAAQMGADAATVLSGLLGTQGVINACFNA